jgi:hypothetical protein
MITRIQALLALAFCLAACAPERVDDSVVAQLEICPGSDAGAPIGLPDAPDAICDSTWPPGTKLAIAPWEGFPCAAELDEAKEAWAAHGVEFAHVADADFVVILTGPTHDPDGPRGRTSTTADRSTGFLISASFVIRECEAVVIAHEIGHVLGLRHATRAGALLSGTAEGWDISDVEVAAISDRAEHPHPWACR